MTWLFGPNGAGKTTLVNVLTVFQPASSGEIFLGGVDVSPLKPHKLRCLGIARIFQGGRHPGRGRSGIRSADGGGRTGGSTPNSRGVAEFVVWLCSDAASFVTGAALLVTAGT